MRNWQRWILMAMTALCAATALWCGALYLSQLRDQAELEKLAEEILRPESSDALPGTAEPVSYTHLSRIEKVGAYFHKGFRS